MTLCKMILSVLLGGLLIAVLTGCAQPVEEVMKATEAKLNQAIQVGAETAAYEDYQKAQETFDAAMEALDRGDKKEARKLAQKAGLYAEDAVNRAQRQSNALTEEERNRDFQPK